MITRDKNFYSWLDIQILLHPGVWWNWGTLEGEESHSKPDEQLTQKHQEMNNNQGIYNANM